MDKSKILDTLFFIFFLSIAILLYLYLVSDGQNPFPMLSGLLKAEGGSLIYATIEVIIFLSLLSFYRKGNIRAIYLLVFLIVVDFLIRGAFLNANLQLTALIHIVSIGLIFLYYLRTRKRI